MHRLLFDHPVVRRELAALAIPTQIDRVPGGLREVSGGALADEAVAALTGRRYEDFRLDRTHKPWTPWFFDVAWDHTLVLTDYRNAEMTVLCITDTD